MAIVVPGSSGIGRRVDLKLADKGAKVVVASRNKRADLDKTAAELKNMEAAFLALPANLGSSEDIANLVEKTLLKF
jgi:3-oxoacyl-[acyl-carrier protein] reductase